MRSERSFRNILPLFAAVLMLAACGPNDYVIHTKTPSRPKGQTDVIGLALPPMDTVRVGFIGLGMRGPYAVKRFCYLPQTKVVALCDLLPENVEKCQAMLAGHGRPEAAAYSGSEDAWKELCERDDINLVYIATDWKYHAPMALSGGGQASRRILPSAFPAKSKTSAAARTPEAKPL